MTWQALAARAWLYRWPLAGCLLLMLAESAAVLAVPWLGGRIASGLLSGAGLAIDLLAPALLVLLLGQAVLRVLHHRWIGRTSIRIVGNIRHDLYTHLQRLPLGFFQQRRQADLISMLTWEVEMLGHFITGTLLGFVPQVLTLAGALVLMLVLDPLLSVPVVLGVPAFYLTMKIVGRQLRPISGQMRDAYASVLAVEEENLAILPAIKSFTREDLEAARHRARVDALRALEFRHADIHAVLGPAITFIAAAAVICVVWLSAAHLRQGQMTPGELVAFLLYAALLTRPVATLANAWAEYQHARRALTHMDEVLAQRPEPSGHLRPDRVCGAIRVENLHFAHPDRPPLLQGLTLEVPAGTFVALTGENGAGKSTLVELLMRFHQPQAGRILLDGIDIASLDLETLRRAIAYVPQEPMLIDGSIGDNVRFGAPGASADEVAQALRRAQGEAFVAALPGGLDTRIGDRGIRLSGGQRQRIALARALVKDPAILILDEPTAMFDPAGEAAFVATAREALRDRTVILITHRPASLSLADRVLLLENGRVAETAEHEHAG